ncbi:MAG: ATP-binding protein [Flavobacteriales bacterium]|nr:ATP-binding protein [Flavobacteriales bacterium]
MVESKTIEIRSKIENITLVEKLVDDICEAYGVGEDYYGNILIAMTEAVNNAITHGNKKDPDKMVRIKFVEDDDVLKFVIEDEGPGFDYENLPDPTSPENLEKPNGRGVFLMSKLADEIEFDETGAHVELSFNYKVPVE